MFWGIKENNTTILERALMKTVFVAINSNQNAFRSNVLEKKSIIQVEEVARERPEPPEPGEPEEIFNEIIVETNTDTNNSYIFLDRTMFEELEQEEVDELVYQIYEQVDFSESSEEQISMLNKNGDVVELNVSINAQSYTAEDKEEPKEDEEQNESCSTEASKEKAEQQIEESKKEQEKQKDKKQEMSEMDKNKHPKYSTSNAKFQKDKNTNRNVNAFKGDPYDYDTGGTIKLDAALKDIHEVEAILEHAIVGDKGGKSKTSTPSKRLNLRSIILDRTENEYITTKGVEGKDIVITMIVDRSGSMNGSPIYNSNIIIQALNNMSFKYPELDVQIILSCTGSHFEIQLPVDNPDSSELWELSNTGGAEGLKVTMDNNFARLKESDINLVYTDGSIQDDAIDKKYMQSQEVELIGLYTNHDFSAKDIMKHHEKCAKYFTKTIIRKEAKSLVNELANMMYLTKNSGH